jgi:DNA-binding IclR family transcriptional regulator
MPRARPADPPAAPPPPARAQRGIQSVEVGGRLLVALAHAGQPLHLKDLARAADMSPAKAHPYLVSFGKLGLVAQDEASGRYGLGALALQLGLISMHQFEPLRLATPRLRDLAQDLGHTMAIAVWGNRGATVVRIEEAPSAVHVNMRHGTVVSLRGTASGMLFAAHLPREQVLRALAAEPPAGGETASAERARPAVEAELEARWLEIRRHGVSRVIGGAVPGVSAMAAPVFDAAGRMVLALTAIGPSAVFDARWDGAIAAALKREAQAVSRQLGAPAAAA